MGLNLTLGRLSELVQCWHIDLAGCRASLHMAVDGDSTVVCRFGFVVEEEISLRFWDSVQIDGYTEAAVVLIKV